MTTPIVEPVAAKPPLNWRFWMLLVFACMGIALIVWSRVTDYTGVDIVNDGERVVIRPSRWWIALGAIPVSVFFAMGLATVTVRHPWARVVGALMLIGAVFTAAILPSVLIGELVVTPEGFAHTAGFWWRPETKRVQFAELESIDVRPLEVSRRYSTWAVDCKLRGGQVVSIPKSTVLEAGLEGILDRAEERGILVRGWAPLQEGGD